jgi:hypothetical protein
MNEKAGDRLVEVSALNYGHKSGRVLTIRISRSVSFDDQSRFSVSTQTLPVVSSTFGCQIFVLKEALGGLLG